MPSDSTDLLIQLMAWSDLVVSAAGSTCWELAFMGTPAIILTLSEDQVQNAEGLAAHGVAYNLGWHMSVSEESIALAVSGLMNDENRRQQMSLPGRQLVDREGAQRVVAALKQVNE